MYAPAVPVGIENSTLASHPMSSPTSDILGITGSEQESSAATKAETQDSAEAQARYQAALRNERLRLFQQLSWSIDTPPFLSGDMPEFGQRYVAESQAVIDMVDNALAQNDVSQEAVEKHT